MKLKDFLEEIAKVKEKYGEDVDVKILGAEYIRGEVEDEFGCYDPMFLVIEKSEDSLLKNDVLGL